MWLGVFDKGYVTKIKMFLEGSCEKKYVCY